MNQSTGHIVKVIILIGFNIADWYYAITINCSYAQHLVFIAFFRYVSKV